MSTVTQIETSIQSLPAGDFFTLLGWMTERHLEVLAEGEFEAPELEAAMLDAVNSPRHCLDDAFFDRVRALSAKIDG